MSDICNVDESAGGSVALTASLKDALSPLLADAGVPIEMRGIILTFLEQMAPETITQLVMDAQEAKSLMDQGKHEEARAIIQEHRATAEEAGLGAMFDSLIHV